MRERQILFNGEMVRAVLEGRKTQTRRVVEPSKRFPHYPICDPGGMADPWLVWWHGPEYYSVGYAMDCPFGQPGDRLWVRENFAAVHASVDMETGEAEHHGSWDIPPGDGDGYWRAVYAADGWGNREERGFPWRPSIHMPRWASRITLEVVGVRVERLQEITEEDAHAEGIERMQWDKQRGAHPHEGLCRHCGQKRLQHVGSVRACFGGTGTTFDVSTARGGFSWLWDSLAKPGATWADNPWVWVVEFNPVEVKP